MKRFPNKWDMPSAGHVKAGETILQGAIRETEEELGVKTKEDDHTFIKEYICDNDWDYVPGLYLVRRAGGKIFDEDGCHIGANSTEFLELLKKEARYSENEKLKVVKILKNLTVIIEILYIGCEKNGTRIRKENIYIERIS